MEINGEKADLSNSMTSSSSTPRQPATDPLDGRWVAALFAKLQGRYGHKWASAYPSGPVLETALAEWSAGLAGFMGNEIKHGLDTWESDWPPTLPEFQKACRPKRLAACHAPFPALPKPQAKLSHSLGEFLKHDRASREA